MSPNLKSSITLQLQYPTINRRTRCHRWITMSLQIIKTAMKIKKTISNCNKSKRSKWSRAASWSRYHPRTIWGSAPPPKLLKSQTSKSKTQVKATNFLQTMQSRTKCNNSIPKTHLEIPLSSKLSRTKSRVCLKKIRVWRLTVTATIRIVRSSSNRPPSPTTIAWRKSPKALAKD